MIGRLFMEDKDIYSKIRDIRQARGLTVNTLAQKIGEDHQKVGRIERGKRSLTIDYLMKVSKALDTPLEEFFTKSNKEIDPPANSMDLLNEVIISVEETNSRLSTPLDPKSKGKLISKIYELTLKFPEAQQRLFLDSFLEGFLALGTSR
jgi:transcriptional regulator with XRE-family HTH domain